MHFVACQKQSLPAHYIYSMSCSSCNALNSAERNHTCVFNNNDNEELEMESYKLFKVSSLTD